MTASGARRPTASGTARPSDEPLPADRRERSASRGRASRISTAARRLAAAGLIALAGLAAGLLASGEAQAQTSTDPIWTATLTVGETSLGDGNRNGS